MKRGIVMERELWAFVEWQAIEDGERSASSLVRRWVFEKYEQHKRAA